MFPVESFKKSTCHMFQRDFQTEMNWFLEFRISKTAWEVPYPTSNCFYLPLHCVSQLNLVSRQVSPLTIDKWVALVLNHQMSLTLVLMSLVKFGSGLLLTWNSLVLPRSTLSISVLPSIFTAIRCQVPGARCQMPGSTSCSTSLHPHLTSSAAFSPTAETVTGFNS